MSYAASAKGYRHRILERAYRARVRLVISAYILDEVRRALVEDFGWTPGSAIVACKAIPRRARLVALPASVGNFVPDDPGDNPVVQTALTGKADVIVTADKAMLAVGKVRDVEIVTLDEFVGRLPVETP